MSLPTFIYSTAEVSKLLNSRATANFAQAGGPEPVVGFLKNHININ